ncbi:MAG TPA: hypothetical protein VF423_13800 [Actinomycetes bacterium]
MTKHVVRKTGVVAVVVTLLCAACAPTATEVAPRATSPSPSASGHDHAAGGGTTPRQVRLLLEQLLGHHAILMVRLMRGPIDDEEQFVDAAQGALQRNTDELADAITSVYGDDAGSDFASIWTDHIDSLVAYSRALADGDTGARDDAMRDLDRYSSRYGEFIATLTDGELSPDAVADGVSAHIHHMLAATDDYEDGDYEGAFEGERTAYAAMFGTGEALSGAAIRQTTGELPAGFDSPPADLRSALGRLLGEHVELAFDATRAVVAGSPAVDAAAGALNENTEEIIAALQGALGRKTASQFSEIWAAHIDAVVQFAVAVADDDDAAQARARTTLDEFPQQLGTVLPAVSKGRVAASAVIDALQEHDEQLLQQVTAFAAEDYATSHDLAYAGYHHMFAIAETLAVALEGHAVGTAPKGGAATGGGGMSAR